MVHEQWQGIPIYIGTTRMFIATKIGLRHKTREICQSQRCFQCWPHQSLILCDICFEIQRIFKAQMNVFRSIRWFDRYESFLDISVDSLHCVKKQGMKNVNKTAFFVEFYCVFSLTVLHSFIKTNLWMNMSQSSSMLQAYFPVISERHDSD